MDIDQIEMMMMQMDKLPELFGAFNDIPEMGSAQLPPQMFDNAAHYFSSPQALTNQHPQSTISFSNMAPVHDASRWRGNNGEMLNNGTSSQKRNSMAAMREMIFRIAAMQPIHIDPESVKPPKRRNVKISKDPQSVAARHRRERISERIRILQRLVPGGTKMDTASMLDEAIHYVKFLKNQVQSLERAASANNHHRPTAAAAGLGFPIAVSAGGSYLPKVYQPAAQPQNVQH